MTTEYLNLVRQSVTAAPGVGSFPLGSAITGFLSIGQAGGVNSRTYAYGAEGDFVNGVATKREVGYGVWTATTNVLSRVTVKNSTAGGTNKEAFGADCEVVILPLADDLDARLVASANLSDVSDRVAAFTNIKQAATIAGTGVVELATRVEAEEKTDAQRAVTPAGLANYALLSEVPGGQDATTVLKGVVELATQAETEAQADGTRAVTPAGLVNYALISEVQALALASATMTNQGLVELATRTEAEAQADNTRAVTPYGLANYALLSEVTSFTPPDASLTAKGIVELATQAEAEAKTDPARAVTPLGLTNYVRFNQLPADVDATTTVKGQVELATQAEAEAQVSATLAVTPAGLTNYALLSEVPSSLGAGQTIGQLNPLSATPLPNGTEIEIQYNGVSYRAALSQIGAARLAGTAVVKGAETVTHYITVSDGSGGTIKLAVLT